MLTGQIWESAIFFIDGGDIESYSGRGTHWIDLLSISEIGAMVNITTSSGHLNFNGTTSRVDFVKSSDQDNIFVGGGTLSFWVRPESDGGGNEGHIIDTTGATLTDGYFAAFNQESAGRVGFRFQRNFSTTDGIWEAAVSDISLDEWVHVVVVYDDSSVANDPTILINGISCPVTEVQTPVGSAVSDAGSDFIIGNQDDDGRGFDGDVEIVLLHNTALSNDEARQLFLTSKDRFFIATRGYQSFSVTGIALAIGVDVHFAFSGAAISGTIDLLAILGIGANKLAPRRGVFSGVVLRSSLGVTVDVFVVVNGTRTEIATGVVLSAGATTVVSITTDVCFAQGDELRAGIEPAGIVITDIEAELEIEYF